MRMSSITWLDLDVVSVKRLHQDLGNPLLERFDSHTRERAGPVLALLQRTISNNSIPQSCSAIGEGHAAIGRLTVVATHSRRARSSFDRLRIASIGRIRWRGCSWSSRDRRG